jgi:predicted RNase H-like HicB family nuclease
VMQYVVIIERNEDDSGFGAYVPDLPGCVATGQTYEEVKERITFSIPLHLESLRSHGERVPRPLSAAEIVEVAA